MNNTILPIGTIIKISNKYLAMVIGYFGYKPSADSNQTASIGDYEVTPFPFDCMNIKNDFKALKKYDFFKFDLTSVSKKDITEIVYMGYKNNEYNDMVDKLK